MPDILQMNKEDLLALRPEEVNRRLTGREILHLFKQLEGFWEYDYEIGLNENAGYHALLKSGYHSDGFLNSKEVLKYPQIRHIIAQQLFLVWQELNLPRPSKVAGIPTGATPLGEHLAPLMGADTMKMEKGEGRIRVLEELEPRDTLLLVEDFCTEGTGFKEAVADIKTRHPEAEILPFELVIINRGGLKEIETEYGAFQILSLARHRINDWYKEVCPLCLNYNSIPIKPKETKENWDLLINSQK